MSNLRFDVPFYRFELRFHKPPKGGLEGGIKFQFKSSSANASVALLNFM